MQKTLTNTDVLKTCKIFSMLAAQADKEHLSFHTPGHKKHGFDITELSYSDNLSCPQGCILEAEKDISAILGASKSFILTDGSTCGILSMLYAAKTLGAKTVAFCESSHKSLFNGCAALGLTPLTYAVEKADEIPFAPTMYALNEKNSAILERADVLFLTSPDYYGNVADLRGAREWCDKNGKILLIDGAHGGHLHFDKNVHAGGFADMWVDGVHKSLPAFTQGAVVSARTEKFAEALQKGVDIFRTTSPSYPIMASVEYAVKCPRNEILEKSVYAFAQKEERVFLRDDWTKLFAVFGKNAFKVAEELETKGIYAEFCDGNGILFYLSPATLHEDFERLQSVLCELFQKYPYDPKKDAPQQSTAVIFDKNGDRERVDTASAEWVNLSDAEGKICANNCGLFPPCTPLIFAGEEVTKEKIDLLQQANNVFGLCEGKILVLKK